MGVAGAAAGKRVVAVIGVTGMQGSAVARRLRDGGWQVRGLTRKPEGKQAGRVAGSDIELVRADMDDTPTLDAAFTGVDAVFCVQNHHISGVEGELSQAKAVTDAALRAGVSHVVYSSAGVGSADTGVGSWDVKVKAAEYMRRRDLPVTILRPMAFMELMTASKFFPGASTWHTMPRLMGEDRPVGWLAVDDLAAIVAKVLSEPDRLLGEEIPLVADVRTLRECRELWQEVTGRPPRRIPLPLGVFERFVGTDETTMWRWLGANEIDLDTGATRELHPEALTVPDWLRRHVTPTAGASRGRQPGW